MPFPKFAERLPTETQRALHAAMILLFAWDGEIFAHSEQVARELLPFAPAGQEEAWYWAGLLHDVGKVTLPSGILQKRGALSRAEMEIMRQHPLSGAAILEQIGAPPAVVQAAKFHHERWDGDGYPHDMRRRRVPLVARVLAVADVYNALISDRPYRRAFTLDQARLEIERNAGTQFDPEIVEAFFAPPRVQDKKRVHASRERSRRVHPERS